MVQDRHNNNQPQNNQTYLITIAVLVGIIFLLTSRSLQPVVFPPAGVPATSPITPPPAHSNTIFIRIMGQNNDLSIIESESATNSDNLSLTGQNQDSTIYISYGTTINLSFLGQNNDVHISRRLVERLQVVEQAGQNNNIITTD